MNYYHIWCNLNGQKTDLEFVRAFRDWMDYLQQRDLIAGYRITRKKLGLGPDDLGEFHLVIEVRDLAQLDRAFNRAATRDGEVEPLHAAVYSAVKDLRFALYRDFPDPVRRLQEDVRDSHASSE